jgi:hypothetical protein
MAMPKTVLIILLAALLIPTTVVAGLFVVICSSTQNFYVAKDNFGKAAGLVQEAHYEQALTLLNDCIKHDRKFYYLKGWDELFVGSNPACAEDLTSYLAESDVSEARSSYAVLAAALAYRKNKQLNDEQELLKWWQKYEDRNPWPAALLKFFRGEYTQEHLLKQADSADKMIEAKTCLGIVAATNGETKDAIKLLRWVKDQGSKVPPSQLEATYMNTKVLNTILFHQLAASELQRLDHGLKQ